MYAILSQGDAAVIVAVLTVGGTLVGVLLRGNRKIEQINRAVNHVGADEPTLIQRVVTLEAEARFARTHRHWMGAAVKAIAFQVGLHIPEHPDEGDAPS